MKLFINASNLRFGGGKTVGINLVDYYLKNDQIERIVLIAPVACGYEIFKDKGSKIKVIFFPKIFNISIFKIFSNYLCLPFFSLLYKSDYVFSLGNIAFPSFKTPQLVLIHQAFLAYPESIVWERIKKQDAVFYRYLRNMLKFISFNLRFADLIGVQTEAMKNRISNIFNIPLNDVFLIPNAISFTSVSVVNHFQNVDSNSIKLLFLSKYYPHKNFEVLYEFAALIKNEKLPITITITIDAEESEGGKFFLSEIDRLGLDDVVKNVGNIKLEKIAKIYSDHDGLFLPTLLESFSGTYIESMYFAKPIFTSNMDFAVDVCKDAAFYFDPLDARNILDVVCYAFNHPELLKSKVSFGKEYIQNTKSWNDIGKQIDSQILKL